MKSIFVRFSLCFAGMTLLSQSVEAQLATRKDSISYALGANIVSDLSRMEANLDMQKLAQGILDAAAGRNLLGDPAMQQCLGAFNTDMQNKQMERQQAQQAAKNAAAGANLEAANSFLAQNKTKAGVMTTPSGLQYEIVKNGGSAEANPKLQDEVTVHYEGKLLNGKIFDSSYQRGQTISFPLNGVIKGWQEGVQLMKPGDIFMFYIHPDLGYGANGAGDNIGPNELLIFKVELFSVKRK